MRLGQFVRHAVPVVVAKGAFDSSDDCLYVLAPLDTRNCAAQCRMGKYPTHRQLREREAIVLGHRAQTIKGVEDAAKALALKLHPVARLSLNYWSRLYLPLRRPRPSVFWKKHGNIFKAI